VRQLGVELRRFFARRIVRGVFLVAVLLIVLVVTIGTAKGHPGHEYALDPATGRITDTQTGQVVANKSPGEYPSQFSGSDGQGNIVFGQSDTRTNIGNDLANVIEGTGIALLFAAFALGASFVGAEFHVGSLTTQLLFEPRRWRVHLAKAVAVALGAATFAFALLALVALALYIGSELNGVVSGLDGAFVAHRTAAALRVAAVAGVGGMLAYSVTLVARRSSAGMIAFFLQFILLSLIDPAKKPFGPVSHYMPLRGLLAVVVKHPLHSESVQERAIHTMAGGVTLTAVWIVVIVGGAGLWFARSEVR
jgi:ABC-2 type transport system permease protein